MKLCLISDTHNQHDLLELPPADVLIHAGDLSMSGTARECQRAIGWLNAQPYEQVILVAGNHDFAIQNAKDSLDFGRVIYLQDMETQIDGHTFYGSPWQPWFHDWAFNVPRGEAIRKYWDQIPDDTDVLITHGPAYGILDQAIPEKTDHLGCEELDQAVFRVRPTIHVFGHIHGSYGQESCDRVHYVNASQVNENYQVVNSPIVVEI